METLKARKRVLVNGILAADRGSAVNLTEADIDAFFG